MAGLIFDDYYLEEASYKKNKDWSSENTVNLSTTFTCEIDIRNSFEADVSLFAKIGDVETGGAPFEVNARIVGKFKYNEEDSDEIAFESYLSENAIAILFPYLRGVVSDISSKSNEFPTIVLPVVNVVKLLSDTNSVNINRYDDKKS